MLEDMEMIEDLSDFEALRRQMYAQYGLDALLAPARREYTPALKSLIKIFCLLKFLDRGAIMFSRRN